ncbi:hypothetical protein BC629DRAFT_1293991 [Irpex lacteus]|nr:hypothetical protein BC629DRAFT_1293991 [Irpex lacteus]
MQRNYRCRECVNTCVLCKTCIVEVHTHSPLHFVEYWNRKCFERCTLAELGLILRLGHSGAACPSSKNAVASSVTIVHTNSIQDVRIMYCDCRLPPTNGLRARPLQLLAARMWPTSYHLSALRYFQQLLFQSKIPAYDFIGTLRRLTDNPFGSDVKSVRFIRYGSIVLNLAVMRVYRHYQFLCELKWNAQSVSRTLPPGSLAVLCPACPQPGINMDPKWQERPRHLWHGLYGNNLTSLQMAYSALHRYLDALHYGKDGNFRLNQHHKKMDELDTPLTEGAAYYADSAKHQECKQKVERRPDLDGDVRKLTQY